MKHLFFMLLAILSLYVYADKEDLESLQKQQNDWYIVKQDNTRNITTYAKFEEGKKIRSFKNYLNYLILSHYVLVLPHLIHLIFAFLYNQLNHF